MADERDGTRAAIATALDGYLTPEQIKTLIDEVLEIRKKPWAEFACKKCGARQRQQVEVPDARAVTSALTELLNQSFGRPTEVKTEQSIVVNREVFVVADDPVDVQGE